MKRACVDNDRRHHELLYAGSFNVLPLLLLLLLPHAFRLWVSYCVQPCSNLGLNNVWLYSLTVSVCDVPCTVLGCCYYPLETCSTQVCVVMPFSSRVNFRCFQFIIARATEMRTVTDVYNSSISTRTTCSEMEEHTSSTYNTYRSIARSEHLLWCSCQAFL